MTIEACIIVFKDHKESFVFTEYGRPDIKR